MTRIYTKGRDTGNYNRGRRLVLGETPPPGTALIIVNHRIETENLVTTISRDTITAGFYYAYLSPRGKLTQESPDTMFLHGFELAKAYHKTQEVFIAVQ